MKIAFFGAGNMSSALAIAIFNKFPSVKMFFYTPSKTKAVLLAQKVNGISLDSLEDMPRDIDWFFLGFKPQSLEDFNFNFLDNSKVVSILAGTDIARVKRKFPKIKLIRLMPNTPCQIALGMNLVLFESNYSLEEQKVFLDLILSCGEVEIMENESDLDLLTPFSGSGPGIIFELAQYFENSLKNLVGNKYDTKKIIAQTFLGSSQLMLNSSDNFEKLRDNVTSKKGVTIAAIDSLRDSKSEEILNTAFRKAIDRIQEMKKGI